MLYITSRRDVVRRTPDVVVKVYGNVAQARLSLNDADLGAQTFENHMASWRVRLRPGKNRLSIQSGATQDSVTWVLAAPRDDQGE
ncbi:MAG TPA: DUF4982 domain-containing protein [Asticcacaulis sp.]|nr:DUF4982 domain-containing protein [Asticcacaulis sp.]